MATLRLPSSREEHHFTWLAVPQLCVGNAPGRSTPAATSDSLACGAMDRLRTPTLRLLAPSPSSEKSTAWRASGPGALKKAPQRASLSRGWASEKQRRSSLRGTPARAAIAAVPEALNLCKTEWPPFAPALASPQKPRCDCILSYMAVSLQLDLI